MSSTTTTSSTSPDGTEPALELEHVDASYGPFRALFDVSITVPQGGAALALCDDVVLMQHGSVSWQGKSDEAAEVVTTQLFEPGGTS